MVVVDRSSGHSKIVDLLVYHKHGAQPIRCECCGFVETRHSSVDNESTVELLLFFFGETTPLKRRRAC